MKEGKEHDEGRRPQSPDTLTWHACACFCAFNLFMNTFIPTHAFKTCKQTIETVPSSYA